VSDEYGSPTYAADVADGIVELLGSGAFAGTYHLVNAQSASRADWARDVIARAGIDVAVEDVPLATWPRPSTPPRWGVLEASLLPSGEPLRAWPDAMADYAPALLRAWTPVR
jgi:dTDP-4-dehydrorhamnose reductase